MKISTSKKDLRHFGLIFGIGFPIFIGFLIPYLFVHDFRFWTIYIGFPAIISSILNPNVLRAPYKVWIKIGDILGFVNRKIILGLVFIFVLQPIAILMKLTGHDPLKKKNNRLNSYREISKNDKIDLTRIF